MAARANRNDMVVATKVRATMGESFSEGRNTDGERPAMLPTPQRRRS